MATNHTVLALSFVGGCTILAAAIVFAVLMTRAPAPTSTPTPDTRLASAPPSLAPASLELAAPAVPASVRQHGQTNAARALARLHPHYVATCWQPAAAQQPDPPSIPLVFNLSFAPDGSLAGWGVSEDREIHRSEVARCVREVSINDIRIPAPGVSLAVEVTITLP